MRRTIIVLSIIICACVGFMLGIRSQSSGGYSLKNPIIKTDENEEGTAQAGTAVGNIFSDEKDGLQEAAASVISALIPPAERASDAVSGEAGIAKENASNGVAKTYPNENILGHLIVGKYSATVRSDVLEETLMISPGWVPESAKPGQSGMSIIYGHRNRNHLKLLENVQVGDTIVFRYLDNSTATYTVEDVQIFERTADWTLPDVEGDMLVIATCYPFHYTGSAPGKFQVVCRLGG